MLSIFGTDDIAKLVTTNDKKYNVEIKDIATGNTKSVIVTKQETNNLPLTLTVDELPLNYSINEFYTALFQTYTDYDFENTANEIIITNKTLPIKGTSIFQVPRIPSMSQKSSYKRYQITWTMMDAGGRKRRQRTTRRRRRKTRRTKA